MKRLLIFIVMLPLFVGAQPSTIYTGQPTQRTQYKGYVGAEKGIVIQPTADLGTGDFPGQIRVKPDGTIHVWNGTAWIPSGSGGGSTPVLARTEFTILSGTNSATLTNPALANMTLSRISYAGRTYNSSAFTKPYSSSTLTLTTAGANFYNGQVLTITPDSLTGGSGGGGDVVFYDDPGGELVYTTRGTDTTYLVSGAAWEGYADNIDLLLSVATNHYNRFVDAQRNAPDGALKPLMTQTLHDWKAENFRAVSGTDTFAVVVYTDWGMQTTDPRSGAWTAESASRKIQFTRINQSGAQTVYTPAALAGGVLAAMRRLNER